ncbi:MAG TPA: 2-oxo acid dehydrogenase subunit E2 [Clostridiaceae bacterium]|nr:2-oxo acid dehydrogenase subunit E2 [Clostridiaceae bacterium]
MASIVIMPKQGLMMEEGTITQWLVEEGAEVVSGEPLFEMETDKLTITMDAEVGGTLLKILEPVGSTVPITEPIAIVGEAGEDITDLLAEVGSGAAEEVAPATEEPTVKAEETEAPVETITAAGEKILSSPRARRVAEENGIDIGVVTGTGPDGLIIEKDVNNYLANRPAVTPLAANVAQQQGIDLSTVQGTGPNKKITTADLAAAKTTDAQAAQPAAAEGALQLTRGTRVEAMSGMRKAVSRNMLASKNTNAQTNHRMVIDMTEVVALRKQYKAMDIKVSFNDIIVRACAKALVDYPIVNASVEENNIIYHDYVNVGVAVAVPDGLIVPVIRDADIVGLTGIADQSAALIDKARNNKLTFEDYHGGTFTVSSLGMFDIDDFVAIINPPESGILAVGKIAKTPVVVTNEEGEDEIVIRQQCAMCLSYDHRIIDGAVAAQFLQQVKKYLQNPILLI